MTDQASQDQLRQTQSAVEVVGATATRLILPPGEPGLLTP
jgi:hypothetical protein